MQADTGNLNELSQLALIASDASYKGLLSNLIAPRGVYGPSLLRFAIGRCGLLVHELMYR